MARHVPEIERVRAVKWILSQKNRAAAIRAVAKKWRAHEATVRTWVRKGPDVAQPVRPVEPEYPDAPTVPEAANRDVPDRVAAPSPFPGTEVTKIPLATERERATAELERGPDATGSEDEAIARAAGGANPSGSPAGVEHSGSESGPGVPPAPPAPNRASAEDVELVLDTFSTAKRGAVEFIVSRMRPAPAKAEYEQIGELTAPLRIALEANADWIAPKLRTVLESGPWALVGAVAIDAIVTLAMLKKLARVVVDRRGPEDRPDDPPGSAI